MENGLTSTEALRLLKKNGPNAVPYEDGNSAIRILVKQLMNPLILVLIAASAISFFLGEGTDAIIIICIILVNSILAFTQEYRAEKTVQSLKKLISQKAKVMRDGKEMDIDAKALVVGDLVLLNIGDIVPADIRITKLDGMTIDESSLTGESVPVLKSLKKNMAFMGTHVVSGEGMGLVIAIGKNTSFGKTAKHLSEPEDISDFEKGISHLSSFLLKIIMVMTFFIFVVNGILGHGILESFLFALALAVGITPEALPVIITIALSGGARKLAKSDVIVKKLSAIEDLGNMDVFCTDKTGTLTEGHLSLQNFLDANGEEDSEVLVYGMLCGDAGENMIDKAIWDSHHATKLIKNYKSYKVLDRNEFDFERRRMSVLVKAPNGKKYLIVKGALEYMEELCGKKHLKSIDTYRRSGYSTIVIAIKECNKTTSTKTDEKNLKIAGFLTFIDPPRASAKKAIADLTRLGVEIKVLSGDDHLVTEAICKKVGLEIKGGRVITGEDLDALNEVQFENLIEKYNVFSRITPDHKYRIVKSLNKDENRTVAFMGDGINDAPAIKIADVGISVNTATDIAKEAADIIVLQQSLSVIANGVMDGRRIFTNINKYILNTVSANFGNMFTIAIASMFLKFIPLLPAQILLNNLITDLPMVTIASDNVDIEMLRKPKKLDTAKIKTFMSSFGLLSTVFDLLLILSLLLIFKANAEVFRSAWFLESAISEIVITFSLRTTLPFFKSKPGKALFFMSVSAIILLFVMVYSPLAGFFEFVQLNAQMLAFVILVVVTYFTASELLKRSLFKKINL